MRLIKIDFYRLVNDGKDLNSSPTLVSGNEDGTVNIRSLEALAAITKTKNLLLKFS